MGAQINAFNYKAVFLSGLGLIYLMAFVSLLVQVKGLYGIQGILPIKDTLELIGKNFPSRYQSFPSIFWFNSSDSFLIIVCVLGIFFSILTVLNILPSLSLAALFILYLSFVNVGREFLSFQWDILLLETGFLAVLLSLFKSSPIAGGIVLLLLNFLLFKLMLMSGLVKLSSGDPHWYKLSALNYHYETQPIPNPVAFYAHQLPEIIQKFSTFIMFVIELIIPFFIFVPKLRIVAALSFIALQLLIIVTGNYCFFNLLTICLCILLLSGLVTNCHSRVGGNPWISGQAWDDITLGNRFSEPIDYIELSKIVLVSVIAVVFTLINIFYILRTVPGSRITGAGFLRPIMRLIEPLHIVNPYGLFAVMTTVRNEIVVEGSDDGTTWQEYKFKWKPGDLSRIPPQVAPHQPRLDWQMWFAALSTYRHNSWFVNFVTKLLQGSKDVTALLDSESPFRETPPKHIRALLYKYNFNNLKDQSQSGNYWKRELLGVYLPNVSLNQ